MKALNRALALLVGLALLGAGLLAAAESGAAALGRPPLLVPWPHWAGGLRALTLADPPAQLAFGVFALVGLVLLVAEVRPWPKERVALAGDPTTRWWLQRRSVERYLADRVVDATSASRATVRVRPRRHGLDVQVGVTAAAWAAAEIGDLVRSSLDGLGVGGEKQVRVRLHRVQRVG